jgi:simple sugar transport system ATP-binding protein
MRQGRTIGVKNIADVTERDISRMMVGRDVILKIDKDRPVPKESVLNVSHVVNYGHGGSKRVLDDVSFQIRRGEIVGIAGVEGNGQKEISEIITGMDKAFDGEVTVCGGLNAKKATIREIREAGVAHVSEDRMTFGIVGEGTIEENIISDRYYKKAYQKGLLMDFKKIHGLSDTLIKDFNVKCDGRMQPIRMLSGGNMQKVVAAREFTSESALVIANQPTRGIDVGASEFIRKKLVQMRDSGAGILLISADLNEVMEVSDSLIVMCEGAISAYFPDAATVTEDELGEYMLGIKKMSAEEIGRAAANE